MKDNGPARVLIESIGFGGAPARDKYPIQLRRIAREFISAFAFAVYNEADGRGAVLLSSRIQSVILPVIRLPQPVFILRAQTPARHKFSHQDGGDKTECKGR